MRPVWPDFINFVAAFRTQLREASTGNTKKKKHIPNG